MNRIKILAISAVAGSAFIAIAAQAQEVGSGAAGFANGASVRIVTKVEPPRKDAEIFKLSNGYTVAPGILHRSILDRLHRAYFGYDLAVEPLPGTSQCKVVISPLTSVDFDSSYQPVLLPKYPNPQVIRDGDSIALDLLASPDRKQKVVDYIQFACKAPDLPADAGIARDFSLDDVELRISDPAVSINGAPYVVPKIDDISGSFIWFSVPNKGRFILSAVPRAPQGFVSSGTINSSVISFRSGGDLYEVKSTMPVLGTGQVWNLYVLAEPSFQATSMTFGSAAHFEQLFPKH